MYRITISPEADGGSDHLMHLLRGLVLEFKKDGQSVAVGSIVETIEDSYGDGGVLVAPYNVETGDYDGRPVCLKFGIDFDEAEYQ